MPAIAVTEDDAHVLPTASGVQKLRNFLQMLDVCGFHDWEVAFTTKFVGPSHYGKVRNCFHPVSINAWEHGETR